MTEARPDVPENVKRQLRQEAGFGCCMCGHPFIQYHHIVPWAEDNHFRPGDMMVLCGRCHPLCTCGAVPVADQREHKARPKNIVDGELRGKLYVNARELKVAVAGGFAIDTPNILVLSGQTVLGAKLDVEKGRVLISAQIHASNGQILARLVDNEWSMAPGVVWDFEVHPCHAVVRQGPKNVAFSVDARNDTVSVSGRWYHRGKTLKFTSKQGSVGSSVMRGYTAEQCNAMIMMD